MHSSNSSNVVSFQQSNRITAFYSPICHGTHWPTNVRLVGLIQKDKILICLMEGVLIKKESTIYSIVLSFL